MAALEHPERVGDYVVGEELGAGGMGRVFASESRDGASVAIKLLHPSLASDRAFAWALVEEARLAALVSHPNVVHVIDGGMALDGTPFLVMRRAAGLPLGALIRATGALPMARVRRIASQLLEGLAAIHATGLVHGDLKSDNVLVDEDDHVTIIDFGLARAHATPPSPLDANVVTGTAEYIAPEIIRGEAKSRASDLYAVGVIVYEMLTATTPFAGSTTLEIFERHLRDDVVPPSLRCTDRALPAALERLVMRALAKDAAQRHRSAATFGAALERAIPTTWIDGSLPVGPCNSSATTSTRPWKRSTPALRPLRRIARGTRNRRPMPR